MKKKMKMTIRSVTKQLAMILFNLLYAMKDDLEVKGQALLQIGNLPCWDVSEILAKAYPLTVDLSPFLSP